MIYSNIYFKRLKMLVWTAALALGGCGPNFSTTVPVPAAPTPAQAARLATLPAAYAHADLANGELHFALCRSCHTITPDGPDMTGPNLHGVWGRRAGSKPGYVYSAQLKATGWTWNAATLDHWLYDPRAAVPGTKMSFYGLHDDADRRDVIAYLRVNSAQ